MAVQFDRGADHEAELAEAPATSDLLPPAGQSNARRHHNTADQVLLHGPDACWHYDGWRERGRPDGRLPLRLHRGRVRLVADPALPRFSAQARQDDDLVEVATPLLPTLRRHIRVLLLQLARRRHHPHRLSHRSFVRNARVNDCHYFFSSIVLLEKC